MPFCPKIDYKRKQILLWRMSFAALAITFAAFLIISRQGAPLRVEVLSPENPAVSDFVKSDAGRIAILLDRIGKLDDILAFFNSNGGKVARILHDKGVLEPMMAFAMTEEGMLAERYNPEVLRNVLQCRMKGWRIETGGGQRVCQTGNGGFMMPDDVKKPEAPVAAGKML